MSAGPFSRLARRPASGAVAFIVFAIVSVAYLFTIGCESFQPKAFEYDLVPFYCGGQVVAERRDPYLVEPLRTCEHAIGPVFPARSTLVIPDPLPAYDQAAMAVVAALPYPFVQGLWFVLEIAAFAAAAALLSRTCSVPFASVACTLVISDLYASSILGQIAALSLFGLCLSGWALVHDRRVALALGLAIAMIEPHLGLPALLAVSFWSVPARRVAVGVALSLGLVSLLALPLPVLVEYVERVLPAHALSEINNEDQLSLAYTLHALGAGEHVAMWLANADYAIMLVLGIALSWFAAKRFGAAMLPFGATAFVLLGGPFLHVTQLAAALPAALLIVGESRSRLARAAAMLLAVPWLDFSTLLTVLPAVAGALYYGLRTIARWTVVRAVIVVAGVTFLEGFVAFYLAQTYRRTVTTSGITAASDLAEGAWRGIIDLREHDHVVLAALGKLPTELALVALLAAIALEAFRARKNVAVV